MAETGGATASGEPEESCGGREEEAEAPGGWGKVPGPLGRLSSSHRARCSGRLCVLLSFVVQE